MTNKFGTNVRVFRTMDAPERALSSEAVAVLGYGHLGRTAAMNLRDSGVKVRVGNQGMTTRSGREARGSRWCLSR